MTEQEFGDFLEASAIKNSMVLEALPPGKHREYVYNAVKTNPVVFAIWYSGNERICYCIKGKATPEGKQVKPIAFIVKGAEDAFAMEADWGDGPQTGTRH